MIAESRTQGPFSAEYCIQHNLPVYKIGDLGLVNKASTYTDDEQGSFGDGRFLSAEAISCSEQYPPAPKSCVDIYALGMFHFFRDKISGKNFSHY